VPSVPPQTDAVSLPVSPLAVPAESVIRQIDRYRYIWFAIVGLFLLCSFNGQWHVGPDSAAYRQIGHQLATTGKYFFRDDVPGLSEYHNKQGTIYPGLPIVLAALEKLFGTGPLAPIVFMQLIAAITLVLTYRLMLYRLPRWTAVCVIVGVGTNPRFLQYANEILSDIPFLLGIVITLLGFESVVRPDHPLGFIKGLCITAVGLVIAATMRPTFLILAAALFAACVWGLLSNRDHLAPQPASYSPSSLSNRWRFAWLIVTLVICGALFKFGLDIRHKQTHGLTSGGYESRLANQVGDFGNTLLPRFNGNCGELLENAVPTAFLGFRSNIGLIPFGKHRLGIGTVISLLVIGAGISLAWRNVLWGALVGATIVSLAVMGPVPRYVLMILPLLLAGWGLLCYGLASRCTKPLASSLVLLFGLGFVLALNIAASVDFILTQRGFARLVDEHHHWQGVKHVGFLHAYKFGQWAGIYDLADFAKREIQVNEKVLGPEPTILTYLSGRQIYPPHKQVIALNAGTVFKRAFFHIESSGGGVKEYDEPMTAFIQSGQLREGAIEAGPVAGYRISKLEVPPAPSK
jgi:hypothetical protein